MPAPTSFLQLTANGNKEPDTRGKAKFESLALSVASYAIILNKCTLPSPTGNIAVIPWTVSVQQGNAISQKENRIVVQEDGYYLVFGQVLCHCNSSITKLILHLICSNYSANVLLNSQVLFTSPSTVMGHIIQSWDSMKTGTTELLRCLQEMPDEIPTNTCYTAGQ